MHQVVEQGEQIVVEPLVHDEIGFDVVLRPTVLFDRGIDFLEEVFVQSVFLHQDFTGTGFLGYTQLVVLGRNLKHPLEQRHVVQYVEVGDT